MQQWRIFIAFFRSSLLGYGGGPAVIPLFHKEVVQILKWMDDEEFNDILALGNTLPGPIATKMAGFIGYKIGGIAGMLNAVIATILPTIVLMIIFLTVLTSYKDQPWVQGMANGVLPVVGVMMAALTWQFFKKGKETSGWLQVIILSLISILSIVIFHIHPGVIIAGILVYAILKPVKTEDQQKRTREEVN
ncbi:chromate transporter [Alteribacillus sp. JSM 102045]|uniref:chromate transporter n=1 Tax=Alteribacillus sp. JSM 102045 TaxID=1562101 RepID=UPI0035C04957